jgi:hypothetical protein
VRPWPRPPTSTPRPRPSWSECCCLCFSECTVCLGTPHGSCVACGLSGHTSLFRTNRLALYLLLRESHACCGSP